MESALKRRIDVIATNKTATLAMFRCQNSITLMLLSLIMGTVYLTGPMQTTSLRVIIIPIHSVRHISYLLLIRKMAIFRQ